METEAKDFSGNISSPDILDVDSLLFVGEVNETNPNQNVSEFLRDLCGENWDYDEVYHFRYWILGVLTPLVSILGILGNSISLLILCSRSMSSVFNHLLACLCGADTLFLVSNLIMTPVHLKMANINTGLYSYIFPWVECCSHFSLSLSIFLIISITVERYQAVCFPHYYQFRAQSSDSVSLIMRHIVPSVIFSLLFNITRFISITSLGLKLQEIPAYFKFLLFFQVFHPFSTTGVIPLILLTTLNYKVYSHMSETRYFHSTRRSTRDFLLAKVMTVIVVVFLSLNLPRLCIAFKEVTSIKAVETCHENELYFNVSKTTYIADFVARFCVVINSSINFIIYCMFGSEFRRHLFKRLGKGIIRRNLSASGSQARFQSSGMTEGRLESMAINGDPMTDGTSFTRINTEIDIPKESQTPLHDMVLSLEKSRSQVIPVDPVDNMDKPEKNSVKDENLLQPKELNGHAPQKRRRSVIETHF